MNAQITLAVQLDIYEVYRRIPAPATAFAVKIESLPIHSQANWRLVGNQRSPLIPLNTLISLIIWHVACISHTRYAYFGQLEVIHRAHIANTGADFPQGTELYRFILNSPQDTLNLPVKAKTSNSEFSVSHLSGKIFKKQHMQLIKRQFGT